MAVPDAHAVAEGESFVPWRWRQGDFPIEGAKELNVGGRQNRRAPTESDVTAEQVGLITQAIDAGPDIELREHVTGKIAYGLSRLCLPWP